MLRGVTAALLVFLDKRPSSSATSPTQNEASSLSSTTDASEDERLKLEIRSLVKEFAGIKMPDLLPPDIEAMDHAKEHAAQAAAGQEETPGDGQETREGTEVFSDDINVDKASAKWKAARKSFEELRERLKKALRQAGFEGIEV